MSWVERFGFRRRVPVRFTATVTDPVPGDPDAARALTRGEITHVSETLILRGADWDMPRASDAFRSHVHGFVWLRDLAVALPQERGGDFVRPIISGWLSRHEEPDGEAWRADRIGARLMFWAIYAPYILSTRDAEYRASVLGHFAAAATHAERQMARAPQGMPRIVAAAGLVVAGLMLARGERRLAKAEKLLDGAVKAFVMPHGLPASRCPADLIVLMEWLHMLRATYEARGEAWPDAQQQHDAMARAGIRAARLGDGRLASLHGGNLLRASRIDHVLGWPGMAARGVGAGASSGLQRLESGQTVVVIDAGPPPDADVNAGAHAGALALEYSDGDDRIVTNVGGGTGTRRGVDRRMATAVRTTAAHSTLTLDDVNQSDVEDGAPLGQGVDAVEVERRESEEGLWLATSHDGYLKRFGLTHARDIFLSAGGTDLRGEDRLEPKGRKGAKPRDFAIRFHLTPGMNVTPTADGKGALLKTQSGKIWQMKLSGGALSLDDSLWIGEDARASRTRQLVISGTTSGEGARVRWRFNKVR